MAFVVEWLLLWVVIGAAEAAHPKLFSDVWLLGMLTHGILHSEPHLSFKSIIYSLSLFWSGNLNSYKELTILS